jgi:hypothetical protein
MVDDGGDMEEEAAPGEPPPRYSGITLSRACQPERGARRLLAPEDETKSQNLRDLQAMLAVVKMATDTGIDLTTAAGPG